ncbi:MAG: tubulin-like doman-containing protein [Bacteroides sp.]|jgi:uncharacterized protein YfbU (UPF0304 family)|nr:tubulin-like doman-containing protein [Bacteroides sp.]MCI1681390.1 tubulin-like doman-containing protein [Bacteroides sp.]
MANHLIIGLGGTGGKVLRELRKRVYEEFHSNDPTNNVNLEYIYVDSSPADLDDRTGWKVMGKSVHLKEAQKVSIHGISASMFQNLSMYPGISCFLNADDVKLMTSKLGPLITAGIGGQRRRLGRTLFANNLSVKDANSDFVSRVKQAVTRITNDSGDSKVTFHICAGLAGGTGSGSIVDAISQIRKEFAPQPGGDHYKVHLYLYVPEMNVVTASHDAGFYQANGYAALCELNAMSIGQYLPLDVTGKKDNFSGEVQRLLGGINAFEAAYLYTNINEAGKVLDIAKGLPASVADFMFQKIVASEMTGDAGKMNRLVGCENDGAGPENDKSNKPARSRKFLSFGIKRIEYPETEIEEFVTYNFARQATRQLQFNIWQEGLGYGECSIEEVGSGFAGEIKDKKNREKLMLSNSYLMLSKPVIESPATKRWHDIDSTWEERAQGFADDAQTNADKKSWLALFTDACSDYYDNNFRSHGVRKFYDIQRGERVAYAKHIRRHIETLLFNEWNSGQKSILEVEKYTRLLIADCEDRIGAFKEQIGRQEEELENINESIRQCNVEWDNIGWLRDAITGASKKVFSAYKNAKCDFYTTSTRIEAYRYAIELMQSVIEQLGIMLDGIATYKGILTEILEEAGRQADSKCKKDAIGEESMTLKKYDPDMVQRFTKTCVSNKESQSGNAQSIRNRLVSLLGEEGERSFANLCDKTDYETTTGIVLDICQQNAHAAMEDSAKADPLNKMVGVNILEKLKQECNSEEKLEQFVRSMVTSAMTYLQFNAEEQGKVFGGNGGGMMKMIQLCLPKFEDDKSGFRDKLIQTFVQVAPGFDPKQDVAVNYKNNQIVVIAAASGFPLRYVANVKVLKQRYEDLLANPDKDLNKMVLHTETFVKPLASLFELEGNEIKELITKPVMLAYAMALFVPKSDPTTGEHFDAINFPDDFGDDNWVKSGKNILHTIDVLSENYELAQQVMKLVDTNLKNQYRSNEQKVTLRKALVVVVKEKILPCPACENNEFSPVYAKYKALSREIFENELKEL